MTETIPQIRSDSAVSRRVLLAGFGAGALIALPGCATFERWSLVDAIRRLLFLSSERAFARMLQSGGFWDAAVARLGLESFLGGRGGVLASILTSNLFKDRMSDAFGDIAFKAANRAAPAVADVVEVIGIENAVALVRGGPTAATEFLRNGMAGSLVTTMVPEVGDALRISQEPLVGQLLRALTGVDVSAVSADFARQVDNTIWTEIGIEEAAIRANPRATNDPLLIGVFGASSAL